MTEVMSIWNWKTNAEMIRDAAVPLGYLTQGMTVLDPTWGKGNFWTKWRPDILIGCDLDPAKSPIGFAVDFRNMYLFANNLFDATVLDGPYRLNGTPDMPFDDSYGTDRRMHWVERIELIKGGITESIRVTKRQTDIFTRHAEHMGCEKVDRLDMVSYRKQPDGRRQVHSRRNSSTMLIFKKL